MPQSITPKDVVISVTGTQKYEGQETQTGELVTDGTLTEVDGKFLVSYAESDMTGLEGTTTTFEVDKHRITLTRTGALSSEMVFEEGRTHESLYDMGFGALLIGVRARRVQSDLTASGGRFRMEYTVAIEQEVSALNKYEVSVREA